MFHRQGCWVKKTLKVAMDLKECVPIGKSIQKSH